MCFCLEGGFLGEFDSCGVGIIYCCEIGDLVLYRCLSGGFEFWGFDILLAACLVWVIGGYLHGYAFDVN